MRRLLFLSMLACLLVPWPSVANDAEVLAVIVPRGQATRPLDAVELSLIFWRKKLYWADGKRMQPVNLPTDHSLRRQFSQRILGSPPEAQTEYWNGLYYHGTSPPHVVGSQEAMLRFIAETPGAIGYVAACKVDSRVKAIVWIGNDGTLLTTAPQLDCSHE